MQCLFNISKDNLLKLYRPDEVLCICIYCKFLNNFLFEGEIPITQLELMFLKIRKVYHREVKLQKTISGCFLYRAYLNLSMFYNSQVNICREVFLENMYSWKYLFIFRDVFICSKSLENICRIFISKLYVYCLQLY